jgi:DNA-binding NtrC family response regulator
MSESLPKVLCVDDEPNILRAVSRGLHGRFDVTTALGAHAALEVLESGAGFDIVLSDMRMPGMDGVTFLTRVALRWPQTVRLLLTGMGDTEEADRAVREGVIFRVLGKPCPVDDLREALTLAAAYGALPVRPRSAPRVEA